jgi:2-iminobutanoate/2-iminopropanoate deaminase
MRTAVEVTDAPVPVGPYSQAQVIQLKSGERLIYSSGQVGIDPARGELVAGGVPEQTEQVFHNLAAVLRGAGVSLADVVKTTVFLTDMADFKAMNEVYRRHFPTSLPARTTIAAAGLPLGARVEIDVVAIGVSP